MGSGAVIRGEIAWPFGKPSPGRFFEINRALSRAQGTHCMFKGRDEQRLRDLDDLAFAGVVGA